MAFLAIGLAFLGAALEAKSQKRLEGELGAIDIKGVPVSGVIRNMAQQIELNYIVDRRLEMNGNWVGPDPLITVRWENTTVEEALRRLLAEHKLKLVTNTTTSVARLVPANATVDAAPKVQPIKDTNAPMPVLDVNEPLADAIRRIAKQAQIELSFDQDTTFALHHERFDKFFKKVVRSEVFVSFRWQNITPRQALTALLENNDLMIIESVGPARIALKKSSKEAALPRNEDAAGRRP